MKNNQPAGWDQEKRKGPESWTAPVNTSQKRHVTQPASWATEAGTKNYKAAKKESEISSSKEEKPPVSVTLTKESLLNPVTLTSDAAATGAAKEKEKEVTPKAKKWVIWLPLGVLLLGVVVILSFFAGKASAGKKTEKQVPAVENSLMETSVPATEDREPDQKEGTILETTETIETEEKAVTEATNTTEDSFEHYQIKIEYGELPIYDGPGFYYDIVGYITDFGTYTIVEMEEEEINGGIVTTWGRLKSGAGWINLIDATDNIQNPIFCQECHRSIQETYIFHNGYCEDCYNAFGNCEKCGAMIDEVGASYFDGKRCYSCIACDTCGGPIEEWEYWKNNEYLCGDCYYQEYLLVGNCDICGAACDVLAGICENCYDNLVYCQSCGRACNPGDSDGICDDCASGVCVYCDGPLGEDHNCDDYPNVICPNCGWGVFTTGVGTDGWDCPECGTNIIPGSE